MTTSIDRAVGYRSRSTAGTGQRRRWLPKLGLALGGALLPLLVVELALRLFGPVLPGNYETAVWAERHPIFGHFHVPGASAWIRESEFTVHLEFNRDGLRGPDLPIEKRPGTPRVLMLGDSFVEAKQVAEPRSVAGRLRSSASPELEGVEWLNSGTFDWGPVQQYLYLRHEGYRFRPDLVVQFFYVGNDVADNFPRSERDRRRLGYPAAMLDDDGNLQLLPWASSPLTTNDLVTRALGERLHLYQAFKTGVLDKIDRRTPSRHPAEPHLMELFNKRETPSLREAWSLVDVLLGSIQSEAARNGARTLLVVVPGKWQVHQEDWENLLEDRERKNDERWDLTLPNQRLAELAEKRDLPILDLLPPLRDAASSGTRLYYPIDIHWTAEGHAVAARALEEYLVTSNLLDSR
jgi:hypothetical protein